MPIFHAFWCNNLHSEGTKCLLLDVVLSTQRASLGVPVPLIIKQGQKFAASKQEKLTCCSRYCDFARALQQTQTLADAMFPGTERPI